MFCPSCGNQLAEGSKFCGACGVQLSEDLRAQMQALAQAGAPVMSAAKKGLSTKMIIGIAVAAVAVGGVALAIGGAFGGGASSPEKVVLAAAEAGKNCDMDGALKCFPDEVSSMFASQMGYDNASELADYLEDYLDDEFSFFEELSGVDLKAAMKKIDVEAGKAVDFSDDELEYLRAAWNSYIPGFGDKIKAAAYVPLDYTIGKDVEFELYGTTYHLSDFIGTSTVEYPAAKIGGKWYLLSSDVSSLMLL